MALGSTQLQTEMSTRNLPGGKGQPARKANILTAICGSLDITETYGPPRPVTGVASPFLPLPLDPVNPFHIKLVFFSMA
jgi:hypothetical protein